jgi:sulfur carrier protein ThiS adenylyltransferase
LKEISLMPESTDVLVKPPEIPEPNFRDRDIRQRDLVPPDRLAACHVLVIGVGAIGRQVALQLAALGVPEMTLIDDDVVAVENLAPQGYWPEDIGQLKVAATGALCHRIQPDLTLGIVAARFRRSLIPSGSANRQQVVMLCVDSIGSRRWIWQAVRLRAACVIDGRMSAEVLRVLTATQPSTDDAYPSTLFADDEAFAGACTAKSTIYTASLAAALMIGQMTKWLRRLPVESDVTLNLLAMELTVAAAAATSGRVAVAR